MLIEAQAIYCLRLKLSKLMEGDQQGPYSVLTRNEVKDKMKKQIDDISGVFYVSKNDATVLFMYLRWDTLRVSERLGEDKDKLLSESGLSSVATDLSDSSWVIINKTSDSHDDDGGLISTPCCSHKFCKTCWREYLDSLEKKNQTVISCPDQDCRASVGPDTIEKLRAEDKDSYESYILRSYIEQNKGLMIKQCPAPDCDYVIEFHQADDVEEYGLNVVCLCGHTFCWRCSFESHRPVTCNNVSDWLSTEVEVSVVDRWEERKIAMEGAQDDLQDFEDYMIKKPDSLKEQDVRIVREGLTLLIQCRQVLKWSCVYEYFHTEHEASKKEYLQFLQDIATTTLQSYLKTLLEETETAFYADAYVLCKFRHNLTTATSNVGNFFYHFIKTLQDGIVDVKVKSYDNVAGPYWLCDRCTYGNSWLDMKCKMCCEASTSTKRKMCCEASTSTKRK